MEKLTVSELAKHFNVTPMAVRYWIKKGLKTETERVIGRKKRIIISLDDAINFLNLSK